MNDKPMTRGRRTRWAGAAGLLAAGAISGGVLAGSLSANAATSPSSAPAATSSATRSGGHSGETQATGTTASKLRAAALKAVPGGTVDRVETDSGDSAYETHMTKADGTRVTVKFDKNLTVTKVENGMGA